MPAAVPADQGVGVSAGRGVESFLAVPDYLTYLPTWAGCLVNAGHLLAHPRLGKVRAGGLLRSSTEEADRCRKSRGGVVGEEEGVEAGERRLATTVKEGVATMASESGEVGGVAGARRLLDTEAVGEASTHAPGAEEEPSTTMSEGVMTTAGEHSGGLGGQGFSRVVSRGELELSCCIR